MKKIFLVTVLLLVSFLSQMSWASRQYTQCSTQDGGLYAVVNLPTKEAGTLFLTAGAETDLRKLLKLVYLSEKNGMLVYNLTEGDLVGTLEFPAIVLGRPADSLQVILNESGIRYEFSCFSRVYPGEVK